MPKISFTRVTWYSQIASIVVFVGVWVVGFWLGKAYFSTIKEYSTTTASYEENTATVINAATFSCKTPNRSFVSAMFYSDHAQLMLSDGRVLTVPQATSASGARYAVPDESLVFWNKGDTAFVIENGATTYADCEAR